MYTIFCVFSFLIKLLFFHDVCAILSVIFTKQIMVFLNKTFNVKRKKKLSFYFSVNFLFPCLLLLSSKCIPFATFLMNQKQCLLNLVKLYSFVQQPYFTKKDSLIDFIFLKLISKLFCY